VAVDVFPRAQASHAPRRIASILPFLLIANRVNDDASSVTTVRPRSRYRKPRICQFFAQNRLSMYQRSAKIICVLILASHARGCIFELEANLFASLPRAVLPLGLDPFPPPCQTRRKADRSTCSSLSARSYQQATHFRWRCLRKLRSLSPPQQRHIQRLEHERVRPDRPQAISNGREAEKVSRPC